MNFGCISINARRIIRSVRESPIFQSYIKIMFPNERFHLFCKADRFPFATVYYSIDAILHYNGRN